MHQVVTMHKIHCLRCQHLQATDAYVLVIFPQLPVCMSSTVKLQQEPTHCFWTAPQILFGFWSFLYWRTLVTCTEYLYPLLCSKFCVRKDFLASPAALKKRLVFVGIAMLILSPCLVIFPLVYLILRHAEEIYNHPSTASSSRWSNLSRWIFREYNEVASHA